MGGFQKPNKLEICLLSWILRNSPSFFLLSEIPWKIKLLEEVKAQGCFPAPVAYVHKEKPRPGQTAVGEVRGAGVEDSVWF